MLTAAMLALAAGCGGDKPPGADTGPGAAADSGGDARFSAFLESVYEERLERSPILAAGVGAGEPTAEWDDLSEEGLDAELRRIRANLERLRTDFNAEQLNARNKVQYRVLEDELQLLIERHRWRDHFYPLNQIVGLHLRVPNILTDGGPFGGVEDVKTYIARIEAVDVLFGQLVDRIESRAESGIWMPESLYPRLIEGAKQVIRGAPFDEGSDNPVWSHFTSGLDAMGLDPDTRQQLEAEARTALTGPYRNAYLQLISVLEAGQAATTFDGGVWQLPDGDAFYQFLLRQFTTTDMSADEVHALGLAEVKRIHEEMRTIMESTGFEGSLEDFFEFMRSDPQFYFDNTDAGRAEFLDRARGLLGDIRARMDDLVYERPRAPVEVRRFEAYREKSAPGAFYEAGSADGSRPAVFYLNLHDMSNVPVYALDALVYHETIPGHHLQISAIQADPEIPELRKLNVWWLNSAFVEGWALYAEQLAKDLGFYDDPYADFGRLSGELWRACRLVVDSGLHHERWSRQRAIEYLDANTPSAHAANTRAVDRYIAVPGQATSFMIGMHRIKDARDRARAALGEQFDLRGFHDAVLRHGYVPLSVMEDSVDAWIEDTQNPEVHAALQPLIREYIDMQRDEARHDGLPDVSAEAFLDAIETERRLLERLLSVTTDGLSPEQDIDRRLVIGLLEASIRSSEARRPWENDPSLYLPSRQIGLALEPASTPTPAERAASLAAMLNKLPSRLDHGKRNLARPPARFTDAAIFQTEGLLDTLGQRAPALAEEAGEAAGDLRTAVDNAEKALEGYLAFLKEDLLPRSDGSWQLGEENYEYIIQHGWFLEGDADAMLQRGLEAFERTEALAQAVAERIDPGKDWIEVYESLKDEHPAADGLKQAYQKEIDAARQFLIDNQIVTLPKGERVITVDTPPAMRRSSPYGTFDSVGPFEDGMLGRLVLTPIEDWMTGDLRTERLRSHHWSWIPIIAVHEAYPGHHVQALKIKENPNMLRNVVRESIFSEGWGLYTEEMMFRLGFLEGDEVRLTQLRNRLWRAARVILDVQLHTGRISFEDAVDFLVEKVRFGRYAAELEVDMYLHRPTYVLGYLIGMQEIAAIRDDYFKAFGKPSPLSEFYDRLLGVGAIPPALVREELLNGT